MPHSDDETQPASDPSTQPASAPIFQSPSTTLEPGEVVAKRYRIIEPLGEGGMGTVYRAQQTTPVKREVALKLIKAGMDSKAVIARFEAERQALALMDHPNVAKVLDGGLTEQQRPYFAMEIVRGLPITEHCDKHKLSIPDRLHLFMQVCDAIQHAHAKGVVHRDLKPANVIVRYENNTATPIVIDFGVAKALNQQLTEATVFTTQGQLIGTPEYMAPEQAEMHGHDIDTRADVYSLGVILYELLTGARPFDPETLRAAGLAEIQRIIREVDPPKPSTKLSDVNTKQHAPDDAHDIAQTIAIQRQTELRTLTNTLKRDLDWVVMKCLEKDRERRYDTPNELAAEIQRFLNDEPVIAGPPSAGYRLSKLVKRNRASVVAVTAIALALLFGLSGTFLGLLRAHAEAERATLASINANRSANGERIQRIAAERAQRDAEEAQKVIEDQKHLAERVLYRQAITLARTTYELGRPTESRKYLEQAQEQHRGWEWFNLASILDNSISFISLDPRPIQDIVFNNDGSLILIVQHGKSPSVSRVPSGKHVSTLSTGTAQVLGAQFIDNLRNTVITWSDDGTVRLWDAASGNFVRMLVRDVPDMQNAMATPDASKFLAMSDSGMLMVWNTNTPDQPLWKKSLGPRASLARFSPNGSQIAVARSNQPVVVFDSENGNNLFTLTNTNGADTTIRYSLDSEIIITSSPASTELHIWQARSGELLGLIDQPEDNTYVLCLSDDGSMLATAGLDGKISLWCTQEQKLRAFLEPDSGQALDGRFSPCGTALAVSFTDGTNRVWDTETGFLSATLLGHTGAVTGVRYAPNGNWLASSSSDDTVRLWSVNTPNQPLSAIRSDTNYRAIESPTLPPSGMQSLRLILTNDNDFSSTVWDPYQSDARASHHTHESTVIGASLSYDSKVAATQSENGIIRIWDAFTGDGLWIIPGKFIENQNIQLSPRGRYLIMTPLSGGYQVWDIENQKLSISVSTNDARAQSIDFNPDESRLAIAAKDNDAVTLWNLTRSEIFTKLPGHGEGARSAAFDPSGKRLITTSEDGNTYLWDALIGTKIANLSGHSGNIRNTIFSKNGELLFTSSTNIRERDGIVKVWNARSGALRGTISVDEPIIGVYPSAQNNVVAVVTGLIADSQQIQIWDLHTFERRGELVGHGGIVFLVSISPDGSRIIYSASDRTIRVWDGTEYDQVAIFDSQSAFSMSYLTDDGTQLISISMSQSASINEVRLWDSVPFRVRFAERRANERGEDGYAIVQAWLDAVKQGTEDEFVVPLD